jgi:hypothetical protein
MRTASSPDQCLRGTYQPMGLRLFRGCAITQPGWLLLNERSRHTDAEPFYQRALVTGKRPWARSTPRWPPVSTIWRGSTKTKVKTRRPSTVRQCFGRFNMSLHRLDKSGPLPNDITSTILFFARFSFDENRLFAKQALKFRLLSHNPQELAA